MARLTAGHWSRAALDAAVLSGFDSVAVEPLARSLGVTKGSFYSHFANRDELVTAALDLWEQTENESLEAITSTPGDPQTQLKRLLDQMIDNETSGRRFAAVCAAGSDPLVAPYALRHALARVEAITRLLKQAGMSPANALGHAELGYAAFIGHWRIKSMFPEGDDSVLRKFRDNLTRLLLAEID
jgi:AcrR family transcriptional regulator